MELVHIYFKIINTMTIITNFLVFFLLLFFNFSLLDPDPGGKVNCGSTRIRIRIHSPPGKLRQCSWFGIPHLRHTILKT